MPIIDFFYRFCDFENMVLCSLNVVKQQSIVCWNMMWWKYAVVKMCCGENMLWWKYILVQICYGENMLWWKYAAVKICCGENMLWWKYIVVKIFCGGRKYAKVLFPPPSDAFRLLKHPGAFVFGNRENASFFMNNFKIFCQLFSKCCNFHLHDTCFIGKNNADESLIFVDQPSIWQYSIMTWGTKQC